METLSIELVSWGHELVSWGHELVSINFFLPKCDSDLLINQVINRKCLSQDIHLKFLFCFPDERKYSGLEQHEDEGE